MDESVFEKRLNELVEEMGEVPSPQRQKIVTLARQAADNQKKLKESVDRLQESLDYLRVSVKYLLFDLDATRREKNALEKLLKDRGE